MTCTYFLKFLLIFWQVGVGMCMEGIEQNPIVYELMSEMAFRDKKVEVPVMFICSLLQLFCLNLLGKFSQPHELLYFNIAY